MAGADAGQSGFRPANAGVLPVSARWSRAETPRAAPVIGGTDAEPVVAWGSDEGTSGSGRIHVRRLADGAAVGTDAGVSVDDNANDPDTFTGDGPGTGLVSSATSGGAGQLFAVHNDEDQAATDDLAIAVVGETTGARSRADFAVPQSNAFTVSTAPILGPPDDNGVRTLYFLAFKPAVGGVFPVPAETRLFAVPITNPRTAPAFDPVTVRSTAVAGGNRLTSPTHAGLRDDRGLDRAHILVGGTDGVLRAFAANDLTAGPVSPDLGDAMQTAAIPVGEDGGLRVPSAAIYVAVAQAAGAATKVVRLVHASGSATFTVVDESVPLPGLPAPALTVTQQGTTAGRLLVSTGKNLFSLATDTLDVAGRLAPGDDLVPGVSGFSRTSAAVAAGGPAFIARDSGEHLAVRLDDAHVITDGFAQAADNASTATAFGRPALGLRRAVLTSDRGLFAYSLRSADPAAFPAATLIGGSASEGGEVVFTVSLSAPADGPSSVTVLTTDQGTASAGIDYSPQSVRVAFGAGESQKTVTVAASSDQVDEDSETFGAALSAPDGLRIAGGTATGTIADVRPAPPGPVATATPVVTVKPGLISGSSTPATEPDNFEIFLKPGRDRTAPYTFTVRSVLDRPAGVSVARGCRGRVTITFAAGAKTIARRRAVVGRTCRTSTRVVFKTAKGFPRSGVLVVRGTYEGTSTLTRVRAISIRARTR